MKWVSWKDEGGSSLVKVSSERLTRWTVPALVR